ncbi:hypothetical protein V1279_003083 [Bradyrhizobium sp. AZCC 1610]|uniref:hypothetical protein n=1 Tax=Bradyrhizobium sp. AZCC 1610 TaxID=3117020 RepID=UPI002FF2C6FA
MDIASALPYVTPFLAIVGFVSGIWYKVEGRITAQFTEAKAAGTEAAKKAEAAEKALAEFKIKVAEEYASWDTVKQIEARLTERMDDLSSKVMSIPDQIAHRMVEMIKLAGK